MTRTLASAALAAAALLAAAPAAAETPSRFLVFVQHGDLDLATAAGQRTLDRRLREAARQTCGDQGRLDRIDECRAAFREAGRSKIEVVREIDKRVALASR